MTILKAAALEGFLRKPDPSVRAALFYGGDASAVQELAKRAVHKLAGGTDDPFTVVKLDESSLAGDPGRLADEAGSLSMLGGDRVIWVKGCDSHFTKAISQLFETGRIGNFIVAEAGSLAKSSAARALFEKSPLAIAVAVYEPNESEMEAVIAKTLARASMNADQAAMSRLLELLGTDAGTARQEIEKLVIYRAGRQSVTLEDVEAICGNSGEVQIDDLIDAVFGGDVEDTDRILAKLVTGGVDPGRIAGAAQSHAVRLQEFKLGVEGGQSAEQLVRAARPTVFFKRVPAVLGQLRIWELQGLLEAAAALASAILQTRQQSAIAGAAVNRALLAVARNGRSRRMPRN